MPIPNSSICKTVCNVCFVLFFNQNIRLFIYSRRKKHLRSDDCISKEIDCTIISHPTKKKTHLIYLRQMVNLK